MAGSEEPIEPAEFSNLILDDTPINDITVEDSEYLNQFVNLEKLCMTHTGLKSLKNLPDKPKIQSVSNLFIPNDVTLLAGSCRQQNRGRFP